MKRYLHHLSIICLSIFYSTADLSAQECATDELHRLMMNFSETYRKDMQESENRTKDYQSYSESENQRTAPCGPEKMNTIPVVVHVIHLGENIGSGSNISDQQIVNAINAANDRFRSNSGQSPDMDIQLVLAKRDPDGNPTNAINRVNGSHLSSYVANGIIMEGESGSNAIEVKSLSIWPRNKYYNIWVFHKISGGSAGYAQYPTVYQYEGTHMDYRYMTASGVTLTHEIGHALNLQHTFEGDNNGNSCPGNAICGLQGDFVCDTPPHRRGDCGTVSSCGNPSQPFTNSSRNIMSYCSSRIHFTDGQRNRMKAALKIGNRSSLLSSDALIPVNLSTDIAINNLEILQGTDCSSNLLKITLSNEGIRDITNVLFRLKVSDEVFYFSYSGEILPNETIEWNSPDPGISTGLHNVLLEVLNVNTHPSDDNAENNFFCGTYSISGNITTGTCYNFEDENIPQGFIFSKNGTVNTYIHEVGGCNSKGIKAIAYNQWNTVPASEYSDEITLPVYIDDVDGLALIYDRAYAKTNPTVNYSTLYIENSADCGISFTQLKSMNGNTLSTTTRTLPNAKFNPRNCDEWKTDTIHIDNSFPNYLLRFRIRKDAGQKDQNIYLDNICFIPKYNIATNYNPEEGIVSGSGLYMNGTTASLSATSLPGYTFAGWFDDEVLISDNASYTLEVKNRQTLSARFQGVITSVKQPSVVYSARIFPNPASDNVYIHLKSDKASPLQIRIRDIQGRIHYSTLYPMTAGSSAISVPISGWCKGIYLIELSNEDGSASYKLSVLD